MRLGAAASGFAIAVLLDTDVLPSGARPFAGTVLLGIWAAAALGLGGRIAERCDPNAGAVSKLAGGALWSVAWIVVLVSVAGAFGMLALLPLALVQAVVLVLAGPPRVPPGLQRPPAELARAALRDPAVALLALTAVGTMAWLLGRAALCTVWFNDDLTYHATLPVEWLQHHDLRRVFLPFGNHSPPYYPANVELLHAWALLALGDLGLLSGAQGLSSALLAVFVAALARELGASRRAAVAAASLALLQPVAVNFLASLYVDVAFAAFTVAVVWALVRIGCAGSSLGRAFTLAVAGALLLGTKVLAVFYGAIVLAPLVVALWLGRRTWFGSVRADRKPVHLVSAALGMLVLGVACGGWWYVRNAVQTGNPLFPLLVEFGGRTLFDGAYDQSDLPSGELRGLLGLFMPLVPTELDLRAALYLLPYALGAVVTLLRGVREPAARRAALLGVVLPVWIGVAVVAWVPFGYPRFALPAHALATLALVPLLDLGPRLGRVTALVCLLPIVVTASSSEQLGRLSNAPQMLALQGGAIVTAGTAAGAAAIALALIALFVRLEGARRNGLRAAFALAALLASGFAAHTSHPGNRFVHAQIAEIWAPHLELEARFGPARVAATGTTRVLPAYGWSGRNRVEYVHVDARTEEAFHDRVRALAGRRDELRGNRTGHGYYRAEPDVEAWLARLHEREIELLVCAKLPPWILERPEYQRDAQGFSLESRWADERPELFERVHTSRELRVYRVR